MSTLNTGVEFDTTDLELLGEDNTYGRRASYRWYFAHGEVVAGRILVIEYVENYMQYDGDNFFRVVLDGQGWSISPTAERSLEAALAAGRELAASQA